MRRRNNIYVMIMILLAVSIGIGYAYLQTNLTMIGNVIVRKYDPPRLLYDEIVLQNQENGLMVLDNQTSTYVIASTGIDFNVAPSDINGKGVYVRNGTESDTYPIYYYRGAVTNNNVIFGGFCWKIVRTTETGGIKLIYNGIPTDGTCNTADNKLKASAFNEFTTAYNAYVGYMYGTPNSSSYAAEHANTNNSTIKTEIDNWFETNMTSYTSYLEDTVWCNDRSFASSNTGTGTGTSTTIYGALGRVYNTSPAPSLECINQNDRFTVNETMEGRTNGNGALTYPVALLTADELTLAGQGMKGYSTTNYLHTGKDWWTMSPHHFSSTARKESACSTGALYYESVDCVKWPYGIRPSLSLKSGIEILKDGDGSTESPYFVKAGEKTITIEGNDDIVSNALLNRALPGTTVTLLSKSGRSSINSFKMNGELIEGNRFIMPERNVTISEIDVTEASTLYEILVNRNKGIDGKMVLDNETSTYVSASTGINFAAASSDTNGKGVYVRNGTERDTYPVYYYRGEETNNNVIFGGFCWKIVRTTETGGIKLIYNGTPKDYFENTPIESSGYTSVTNDATYAYTYDSTTKNWTSTNKANSKLGTITFSVATAGYYAINYVVSSESSDKAYFYLDDVELGVYSGETSGSISLGEITPSNVITVKYTKDSSGASGSDTVSFNVGLKTGEITKSCDNKGKASQIGTSAFNPSYNYNAYVGYMYGTPNSSTYAAEHANTNNSTIKTAIDTWYAANMASYTDKLEDTVWCNDRSFASSNTGTGAGTSSTKYGAYGRVGNSTTAPSLECINQNDRFTVNEEVEGRVNGNGALTYPVALLTADELTLAGNVYNGYSTTNYLNTWEYWWSLSPYNFEYGNANEFNVNSSGNLNYGRLVTDTYGARPSVSLLLGTRITKDGDGSVNSPFVVDTGEKTITIEGNDDIVSNAVLNRALPGTTVILLSKSGRSSINSFKMNGTLIEGTSFTMPEGNATITEINVTTKGTITIEGNDDVKTDKSIALPGTTVTLLSKSGRSSINSFKMNGELIEGNRFIMPERNVTISEIDVTEASTLYEILVNRNKGIDGKMVLDNETSRYVSASTGIDFAAAPSDTNGKGVYVRNGTERDTYPVYYYRGEVTNNNVVFANYCWKIVRTTETGGIKLIYNGEYERPVFEPIESSRYTNVTNDATYAYTYDSTTKNWTSTNKTASATGTITFSVATAGDYAINYVVSSESRDKAYFYLDDVELGVYSGETSGSISLGEITPSNVITVKYTKDSSGASGSDTVSFNVGLKTGEIIKSCNNTSIATQIGTSKFNSSYNYNAYLGYMYGTPNSGTYDAEHLSTKTSISSTIKTYIDTWYSQNMTNYASYLEDTVWCNDRTIVEHPTHGTGTGNSMTYYGAYGRLWNSSPVPSLECTNQNDRFTVNETMEGRVNGNGALTYPVALLTADELTLAGLGYSTYNEYGTNYLHTGQTWWSLSPYHFNGSGTRGFYVRSCSDLNYNIVSGTIGVRPAVSLLLGTQITKDGDGSANNPFIVAE